MAHLYENATDARQQTASPNGERPLTFGEQIFRKRYRELSPDEVMIHDAIKDTAAALYDHFQRVPGSPERTLAARSLEVAVFWAVKSLTAPPKAVPAPATPPPVTD